eukprot:CAMPEP_0183808286 /NCGR_PEP_ID=MMETSP0803_2-20130417/43286_1 /TAXON_ID=195967 /ORGANISM="Crustomastix stigmata, Strain CCMP3273" /LENGTH=68 /DNA_ID=CAMNT_0026053077 /DNA_START=109 /DNA_END=312 /DNA_ORIENTATION=-
MFRSMKASFASMSPSGMSNPSWNAPMYHDFSTCRGSEASVLRKTCGWGTLSAASLPRHPGASCAVHHA